ncbi:hypothetical protein Tco_0066388 [Tanacetum coccineum]
MSKMVKEVILRLEIQTSVWISPFNYKSNAILNKELVLFATLLKGETSQKSISFHTLLAPDCNGADVAILKESVCVRNEWFCNTIYGFFLGKYVAYPVVENDVKNTWSKYNLIKSMISTKEDGLSVIETKLDTPLMLDSSIAAMCIDSWGRSSYAIAIDELRADVELKDTIVVVVPKFNPRQAIRGIPVGLMVGSKVCFKPTKQVYQPVAKNNGASANDKHKQARLTRQEVSNSNLFDALNTVENDYDLGTNGENLKLAQKGANFDVVSSSHRTSSEVFGWEAAKKVDDPVNANSDSEVDEVFDETTYNEDPYDDDDFDDCGLTDNQMRFAYKFDQFSWST